jgi:hypothetical protein
MSRARSRIIEVSSNPPRSFGTLLAGSVLLAVAGAGLVGGLAWYVLREVPVPEGCPSRQEAFVRIQRAAVSQLVSPSPPQPVYRARSVYAYEPRRGGCGYSVGGQVFETWQGRRVAVYYSGGATWDPGSGAWVPYANIATED